MAEYIDRNAFIAEKREHFCMDCNKRKGIKGGKVQFCYDIGDAPCRSCDVEDMLDCINSFPAADVRHVVRGRWIKCGDNQPISCDDVYCCSNCKENKRFEWQLKPFCENCGAVMDEKVDDG